MQIMQRWKLLVVVLAGFLLLSGVQVDAQTYFVKDDFTEVSPPVNLESHTPSGTGATGGAWSKVTSSTSGLAVTASPANRLRTTVAAQSAYYYSAGTPGSADYSVQVDFVYVGTSGAFVGVLGRYTGTGGSADSGYWGSFNVGGGGTTQIYKRVNGTPTTVGSSGSVSLTIGHTYTVRMTMAGTAISEYVSDNGGVFTLVASATDSTFTAAGSAGLLMYNAGSSDGTATVEADNFAAYTGTISTAVYADNANIGYVGKWAHTGTSSTARAITLNSGEQIYATITGTATCQLNFDTTNCIAGQYPDILYQMDGGNSTRATLDSTGNVSCTFPTFSGVLTSTYGTHSLKIVTEGVFDGGTSGVDLWGTTAGHVQFSGLTLDSGGSLLASQVPVNQHEVDGDSITETARELGTGTYSQTLKAAHLGWPTLTAQALGMAPVPVGYSGVGVVLSSNGSSTGYTHVPLANSNFGFVYAGQTYTAAVKPAVVIVAYGANDSAASVSTSNFQTGYSVYLATLRAAYPNALIECLVLPQFSGYTTVITNAVAAKADSKIKVLNFSAQSFTTSDGVHLDVAGAAKLASLVAPTIAADMASLSYQLQTTLTASQVAAAILATPANKLATDNTGSVTIGNTSAIVQGVWGYDLTSGDGNGPFAGSQAGSLLWYAGDYTAPSSMYTVTSSAAPTTTVITVDGTGLADGFFRGYEILFSASTEKRYVTGCVVAANVATLSFSPPLSATPTSGETVYLRPAGLPFAAAGTTFEGSVLAALNTPAPNSIVAGSAYDMVQRATRNPATQNIISTSPKIVVTRYYPIGTVIVDKTAVNQGLVAPLTTATTTYKSTGEIDTLTYTRP